MSDLFFKTESARCAEAMRCKVELAKRAALAPLKPKVRQECCDLGLFSDTAAQLDIVDKLKQEGASTS